MRQHMSLFRASRTIASSRAVVSQLLYVVTALVSLMSPVVAMSECRSDGHVVLVPFSAEGAARRDGLVLEEIARHLLGTSCIDELDWLDLLASDTSPTRDDYESFLSRGLSSSEVWSPHAKFTLSGKLRAANGVDALYLRLEAADGTVATTELRVAHTWQFIQRSILSFLVEHGAYVVDTKIEPSWNETLPSDAVSDLANAVYLTTVARRYDRSVAAAALSAWRVAYQRAPTSYLVLAGMARFALFSGDFASAKRLAEDALRQNYFGVEAAWTIVVAETALGRTSDAAVKRLRDLDLNRSDFDVGAFARVATALLKNDVSRAVTELESRIQTAGDVSAVEVLLLTRLQLRRVGPDAVLKFLSSVTRAHNSYATAIITTAVVRLGMANDGPAAAQYANVLDALSLAGEVPPRLSASILLRAGELAERGGWRHDAPAYFFAALDAFKGVGSANGSAAALIALSRYYIDTGQATDAVSCLREIAWDRVEPAKAADAYHSLGRAHSQMCEFPEAVAALDRSRGLYEATGATADDIARVLDSAAATYARQGEFEAGLQYAEAACGTATHPAVTSLSCARASMFLYHASRYHDAIARIRQARTVDEELIGRALPEAFVLASEAARRVKLPALAYDFARLAVTAVLTHRPTQVELKVHALTQLALSDLDRGGGIASATRNLTDALSALGSMSSADDHSEIIRRLLSITQRADDRAQALIVDRVVSLAPSISPHNRYAILTAVGRDLAKRERYHEARLFLAAAHDFAPLSVARSDAVDLLMDLSIVRSYSGEVKKAISDGEGALSEAIQLKSDRLKRRAHYVLSSVLLAADRAKDAREHAGAAAELYERAGDTQIAAEARISGAIADARLGRFDAAIPILVGAASNLQLPAHVRAIVLGNLAVIFERLEQDDLASYYLTLASELGGPTRQRRSETIRQYNLGLIALKRQDCELAASAFKGAHDVAVTLRQSDVTISALLGRSETARLSGDCRLSEAYLSEAAKMAEAVGDEKSRVEVLSQQAARQVCDMACDLDRIAAAERAASAAVAADDQFRTYTGFGQLSREWQRCGNEAAAIFFGKAAINAFQRSRRELGSLDDRFKASYVRAHEEVFRAVAEMLLRQGRLDEAQDILTLLKTEEHRELLTRGGKLPKQPDAPFVGPERAAKDVLSPADLAQRARRSAAEYHQFIRDVAAELGVQPYAGRHAGLDRLNAAKGLRADLAVIGKTAAVYTLIGEGTLWTLLVTPDDLVPAQYPIRSEDLKMLIGQFYLALQCPAIDPRPVAKKLYEMLLKPYDDLLRNAGISTILWSLDGPLKFVPMAALHDGRDYVVERYAMAVFTTTSLPRLKDDFVATGAAVGFGVSEKRTVRTPAGDEERFDALPSAAEELCGIVSDSATCGGAGLKAAGLMKGAVHLNQRFTRQAMEMAARSRYAFIHIASHFMLYASHSSENSFLLIGDGTLGLGDLGEMYELFMAAKLVTLSTCDSARSGTVRDGPNIEGFAELVQGNGAKAVLASLWPVYDESTALLMVRFYKEFVQAGASKTLALQQAQRAILRGELKPQRPIPSGRCSLRVPGDRSLLPVYNVSSPDKPFEHPRYWAAFVLLGNPR